MSKELKRCPFCGKQPYTEIRMLSRSSVEALTFFAVRCECGVERSIRADIQGKHFSEIEQYMDAAIGIWNRRSDDNADDYM